MLEQGHHVLNPGTELGRYTVLRKVGGGSYGAVYLARDSELDLEVAIKVLPLEESGYGDGLKRFKRELVLARQVAHPGICRVFDLHCEKNVYFITMEHIPGESLEEVIQREKKLSIEQSVKILRGLCRAMRSAHRASITHRDLKPTNIILNNEGRPVILDFGLAKGAEVKSITQTGYSVGTPYYMAPEIFEGEAARPRTDIYSLGVILFRCLTGEVPFQLRNVVDVMDAVRKQEPTDPRDLRSDIPEELALVVLKALARSPEDRYETTDQFETDLANLAAASGGFSAPDQSQEAPWSRDIDKTVVTVVTGASYSQMVRNRLQDTTIVFSDIVEITSFFDKHGDVAGRVRLETHNKMLFPVIRDYDGNIVKTIGDAIMASFKRADDAVGAAVEMQRVLANYNKALLSSSEPIHVRIGMHSGKAIIERKDVFGDTVNVAARVSSQAVGEQILISEDTRNMLTHGA
ncbi:MAG: protein kinase, partial [Myxococcota bacterium]|nr:protein kinase [Myxococcota bacterium]